MADQDVSVSFGGDTKDLDAAVARSQSLIQQFSTSIKTAFATIGAGALVGGFKDTGDAAAEASDRVKEAGKQSQSSASTIGEAFAAAGVVVALVAGHFVELTNRMQAIVDPIRAASGAFDQSTQSMSAINAVANRSGLSLNELGNSFHELQTKAKTGDDAIVAALGAIGVKASEIADMTQEQLAVRMADAFSKSKDSANKAQAGVILFGAEVAGKLVPQLDQGAARMAELAGSADRTGQALGPEFAAKVQGTESLLQTAQDRIAEVKNAFQGFFDTMKMGEFEQVKGSLDALIQLFNDVTRNVLDFAENLTGLVGAGQRSSDALGLVGTAANYVATQIIETTAQIEEGAARWMQSFNQVGFTLDGLGNVAEAFGQDLVAMASKSSDALYAAFHEAIAGVVVLFGDLAAAGKAALTFDFSGVKASFAQLGTDAQVSFGKLNAALSPDLLSNTDKAYAKMQQDASAAAKAIDPLIDRIHKQTAAQLALMRAGGQKGSPVAQTKTVGDPSVPDKPDDNSDEKLQAAMKEIDGEVALVKAGEKQKETLLDAGLKTKQISEDQKLSATEDALQDELQDETMLYQQELGLDGLKLSQRQEILNKMQAAQTQYNQAILKLNLEAAEQTKQKWDAAMSEINSSFTGQIDGLLKGTTTFAQAFKNVLGTLLEDVIKFCAEWGLKQAETIAANILGINQQTAAQIAGASASTSAQTAGAATSGIATLEAVVTSIKASAGEAFAGIFGFLSPVLGPGAAGPAAAGEATVMAAAAGIGSHAMGSWALPSDMLSMVHQGEMIVPASATPWAQSLMANAAGGGSSGGSGDIHLHLNALDAQSGVAFIKQNANDIAKAIGQAMQRNPSTRGNY